jgi:protoheme IX farnesyltransferase
MIRDYYKLTKPGIIYGNAITTAAGLFLASHYHIAWLLLLETIIGLSFVIASGCIVNNYFDRDIDVRMERTKNRALVTGTISVKNAIVFAFALGVIGFLILLLYTNKLVVAIALAGAFVYLAIYTPLKRFSFYSTAVGSISGAVPPLVGYCAVTHTLNIQALILFFIFAVWQIPHFYAIGIYRLKDYAAAHIPILPVQKGIFMTKIHMLMLINIFVGATTMLYIFDFKGRVYITIALLLGLLWIAGALIGFKKNNNDQVWARQMFLYSLVVLLGLCAAISFA